MNGVILLVIMISSHVLKGCLQDLLLGKVSLKPGWIQDWVVNDVMSIIESSIQDTWERDQTALLSAGLNEI